MALFTAPGVTVGPRASGLLALSVSAEVGLGAVFGLLLSAQSGFPSAPRPPLALLLTPEDAPVPKRVDDLIKALSRANWPFAGLLNPTGVLADWARQAGWPTIDDRPLQEDASGAPAPKALQHRGTLMAGQVLHARGRDLVISGNVEPGALVSADGSVHVYGRLRGQAMAGVGGDRAARVYCLDFQASLVGVAGCCADTASDLRAIHGQPVEIWLEGGVLQAGLLGQA